MDYRWFVGVGLLLAVILAVVISPYASSSPDGLERVAHDLGFLDKGEATVWNRAPVPDYRAPGVEREGLATALSGLIGTLLTFFVTWGVLRAVRRGATAGVSPDRRP